MLYPNSLFHQHVMQWISEIQQEISNESEPMMISTLNENIIATDNNTITNTINNANTNNNNNNANNNVNNNVNNNNNESVIDNATGRTLTNSFQELQDNFDILFIILLLYSFFFYSFPLSLFSLFSPISFFLAFHRFFVPLLSSSFRFFDYF